MDNLKALMLKCLFQKWNHKVETIIEYSLPFVVAIVSNTITIVEENQEAIMSWSKYTFAYFLLPIVINNCIRFMIKSLIKEDKNGNLRILILNNISILNYIGSLLIT